MAASGFGNLTQRDDQKCDVFKTAKKMVKTNQDVSGEQVSSA